MSKKRFNSVGTVCFTVHHHQENPTAEEILTGLQKRYVDLVKDESELLEAVEIADTIEEEKEETITEQLSSMEWEYLPENSEDGKVYQMEDFINIAKGNLKYAIDLRQRLEGQHPETLVEEDFMEGEITEINGQYIITGGEEEEVLGDPRIIDNDLRKDVELHRGLRFIDYGVTWEGFKIGGFNGDIRVTTYSYGNVHNYQNDLEILKMRSLIKSENPRTV